MHALGAHSTLFAALDAAFGVCGSCALPGLVAAAVVCSDGLRRSFFGVCSSSGTSTNRPSITRPNCDFQACSAHVLAPQLRRWALRLFERRGQCNMDRSSPPFFFECNVVSRLGVGVAGASTWTRSDLGTAQRTFCWELQSTNYDDAESTRMSSVTILLPSGSMNGGRAHVDVVAGTV